MGVPVDQVKVVIRPSDSEKEERLDLFLKKLDEQVWSQVVNLEGPDQAILRGALLFASAAAAEAETDEDLDVILDDFRAASAGHQAVHGEPMEKFLQKYYRG